MRSSLHSIKDRWKGVFNDLRSRTQIYTCRKSLDANIQELLKTPESQ